MAWCGSRPAEVEGRFTQLFTISVFPVTDNPANSKGRIRIEPLEEVAITKFESKPWFIRVPGCKQLPPIFRLIDGG
jgi:hypothetical protein